MAEDKVYSEQKHQFDSNELITYIQQMDNGQRFKPEWEDDHTKLNSSNMKLMQTRLSEYSQRIATIITDQYIKAINKEHENTNIELEDNYQKLFNKINDIILKENDENILIDPENIDSGYLKKRVINLFYDDSINKSIDSIILDGTRNINNKTTPSLIIRGLHTPNDSETGQTDTSVAASVAYVQDVLEKQVTEKVEAAKSEIQSIHTKINTRISLILSFLNERLKELDLDDEDFWNDYEVGSAYCITNGYEDESIGETVNEIEPLMVQSNENNEPEPLKISLDEEDQ